MAKKWMTCCDFCVRTCGRNLGRSVDVFWLDDGTAWASYCCLQVTNHFDSGVVADFGIVKKSDIPFNTGSSVYVDCHYSTAPIDSPFGEWFFSQELSSCFGCKFRMELYLLFGVDMSQEGEGYVSQ